MNLYKSVTNIDWQYPVMSNYRVMKKDVSTSKLNCKSLLTLGLENISQDKQN